MEISGLPKFKISLSARNSLEKFKLGDNAIQREDLEQLSKDLAKTNAPASRKLDAVLKRFEKSDKDKNGIDYSELQQIAKLSGLTDLVTSAASPEALARRSISEEDLRALKKKLEDAGKAAPPGLESLIRVFKTADSNNDGKLDVGEFSAWAKDKGFQKQRVQKDIFDAATTDFLNLIAEKATPKEEVEGSQENLKKQILAKYAQDGVKPPDNIEELLKQIA